MTDRDRDVRERCAEIAEKEESRQLALVEKAFRQTLDDRSGKSHEVAAFSCRSIAGMIRSLDLPLTSAREVTVPDGWQLVPKEPTEAMTDAASEEDAEGWKPGEDKNDFRRLYRAMLANAPVHEDVLLAMLTASAPQPACVGVGVGDQGACKDSLLGPALQPTCMAADEEWRLRLVDRVTKAHHAVLDGRKNAAEDYLMDAIQALASPPSLSPAPSPQAGVALADIAAERRRQIEQEGWTVEHDDAHNDDEMRLAAACYACHFRFPGYADHMWPWDEQWWKPTDERRDLVKAAALLVAEIARLDRLSARREG